MQIFADLRRKSEIQKNNTQPGCKRKVLPIPSPDFSPGIFDPENLHSSASHGSLAERVGFEPTVPLLAEHTISSRAPSASSGISPHCKDTEWNGDERRLPPKNPKIEYRTQKQESRKKSFCSFPRALSFKFLFFILKIRVPLHPAKTSGGEGGIRTHVRAFGPQVDFESTPLRPLRYLSENIFAAENAESTRKNSIK